MNPNKSRSMAKAMSWRVIATLTGAVIVFFLPEGSRVEAAVTFIVLDVVLKLTFYYMHERGWAKVEWGLQEPTTSEPS
jgi:adenylylsulfate kinase